MGRRRSLSVTALRDLVETRAQRRCEYCRAPQAICGYRFHLEHIHPAVLGGSDEPMNRALACASCNLSKGERVSGVDPITHIEIALFNPREQAWDDLLAWNDDHRTLMGLTPAGRATIAALDLNNTLRTEARTFWFQTGWLP